MDVIYLDVAQALILLLGGVVVYYAYRAYAKTKSQAMFMLGLGFAFVILGAIIAGLMYNLGTELGTVMTLQSFSQAAGFLIIVYSLAKAKG